MSYADNSKNEKIIFKLSNKFRILIANLKIRVEFHIEIRRQIIEIRLFFGSRRILFIKVIKK
jgi:hypothetical protein